MRLSAVLPLAALFVAQAALAQPIASTGFTAHHARDQLGRDIRFYLRRAPGRPVALIIQGSGCTPLFRRDGDRVRAGLPMVMAEASAGRVSVLAVEKPGVDHDAPGPVHGTAEGCPPNFLAAHTLDSWVAALGAALAALSDDVETGGTLLVVGHSEGAAAAARLARIVPRVTHVALLSSHGPVPLEDFIRRARDAATTPAAADDAEARLRTQIEAIAEDPDSTTRMVLGHPHRRWTSVLAASALEDLLGTAAAICLVHGVADAVIPIHAHDNLADALARHGRAHLALRIDGANHALDRPGESAPAGMLAVLRRVISWALRG